jgi:hypothetical protein
MATKTSEIIVRAFATVLLLVGILLVYFAYISGTALGGFEVFFLASGVVMALIGVLGLVSRIK